MSEQDPTRLVDPSSDAPEKLRALFVAGAADLPSSEQLARLAVKLGPALAPTSAAGGGMSAATAAKLGLVALAIGGGALWLSSSGSQKAAPPLPTATVVHVVAPAPPAPVVGSPPGAAVDSAPAPNTTPSVAPDSPAPAAKGTTAPQAVESEAAFLERARAALASSPARALTLANQHRSRYPSGVLAQEREVIAIEALKRLGRTDEAARRAGDFSNRYPGSAYGRKLDAGSGR